MYSKLFLVLCLFFHCFVLQAFLLQNEEPNSTEDEKRIIKGTKANKGQYPSTVSLISKMWNERAQRYTTGKYCGGSIIDAKWILTAGHCIDLMQKNKDPAIIVGEVDLTKMGTVVSVEKGCKHPEYIGGKAPHDIGMLKLKEPVIFNQFVQPISLPEENEIYKMPGTTMGWGATDGTNLGASQAKHLMMANVSVVSPEECLKHYDYAFGSALERNILTVEFFEKFYICVGGNGTTNCGGDSGGPFIQENRITGVASFTQRPCGNTPSVLTRVSPHKKWIIDTMNKGDC